MPYVLSEVPKTFNFVKTLAHKSLHQSVSVYPLVVFSLKEGNNVKVVTGLF